MTAGKKLVAGDLVTVCRCLEAGGSRRDIAQRTGLSLHAVQAAIDQAAVRWLELWRRDRQAERVDNLADPH